ncbi:MAG: hypothetical protein FWE82_05710 [Defluviitaleaceae bacterium]|nr:hypothetical protein [Defluviitaleaceae bacterium]
MKKKKSAAKKFKIEKWHIIAAAAALVAVVAIVLTLVLRDDHDHAHGSNPCDVSCARHPASGECHCHGLCGTPGCACHGGH